MRDRRLPIVVTLGLVVALWLPWVYDTAGRTPGLLLLITARELDSGGIWLRATLVVFVLAVLLSTIAVPWRPVNGPKPGRRAARAATLCGLATILAVILTVTLGPRADVGLPAAALFGAAGTGIWALVARAANRDRVRAEAQPARTEPGSGDTDTARKDRHAADFGPREATTIVAVFVATSVIATVGAPWWLYGRHVDATTTEGTAAPVELRGPDEPDELLWSKPVDGVLAAGPYVVTLGDGDGTAGTGENVAVVDAATGRERWRYARGDGPADSMVVSAEDDLVVVSIGLHEDELYELVALELSTGDVRWTRRWHSRPLDVADGIVLVEAGGVGGGLVALGADNGEQVWRNRVNEPLCSGPVRPVGDLILSGSDCSGGNTLAAIERATGRLAWEGIVATDADSYPSIERHARSGNVVVLHVRGWWKNPAGRFDDGVIAFDTASGEHLWQRNLDPTALVTVGDRVVVSIDSETDPVRSFDLRSGKPGWLLDPPREPDGVLKLAADDSRAYVLTEHDGGIAVHGVDADGQTFSKTTVPACPDSTCVSEQKGAMLSYTGTQLVADGVLLLGSGPPAAMAGGRIRVTAIG